MAVVMALAESQLVPQELHCIKTSAHHLVSDQLDVWSHLTTAQGWVAGSKPASSLLWLLGTLPWAWAHG